MSSEYNGMGEAFSMRSPEPRLPSTYIIIAE